MTRTANLRIMGAAAIALMTLARPALADNKPMKIIMVSGPLFDPFFSALKRGADDAAKAMGVEYQYSTIQDPSNAQTEITRALDQAVATTPDVLIVGDYFPQSMDPIIKRAAAAGIPVILSDGPGNFKDLGAVGFVGFNPPAIGTQAGQEASKLGVKDGICINSVAGNPSLEALCNNYVKALEATGGKGKVITLGYQDVSNPQATLQAIKGAMQVDPAMDGILTVGSAQAELAVQAVADTGKAPDSVKIMSNGISTKVLEYLRDGKVAAVFDPQPYLDGYYSIVQAVHHVRYGLSPLESVIVGPVPLTKEDAQKVIDINKQYLGIRGIN